MKTLLCAFLAVGAMAGPLTIQTEEAIWTNGLDTLTIGAATVEGPGNVAIPFTVTTTSPAARFTPFFVTQSAFIGDDDAPFDLGYSGTLSVLSDGTLGISIFGIPTTAPYTGDGSPDPIGRFVKVVPIDTTFVSGDTLVEGTVSMRVTTETPEPSALALMGIGAVLIGLAHRHGRYNVMRK